MVFVWFNFYGTHDGRTRSPEELYRFAEPYKMPRARRRMDAEVYGATMEAVARAREGDGPSLIEAVTYRFRGHSMSDPGEYRSKREERIWQERDPIKNLRRKLTGERQVTEAQLAEIEAEVAKVIDESVKFADESPEPSVDDLGKGVYASES